MNKNFLPTGEMLRDCVYLRADELSRESRPDAVFVGTLKPRRDLIM